jgi:hypothetical protein
MVGCDLPWLLKSAPSGRTTANNREIASASAGEGSPRNLTSNLSETQDFSKIRGGLSGAGRSSEASRSMMYHQLFRHKR